ncbi:methyl-accepting chemotaxis protein [Pseudomonas cichorii]|nr:methyl-accepting chemotaxis protein [Pseudomonas cichorii]MBX8492172.1 methyl-accepting chemotaxis protein [Pseudomonas cichorii]MBX8510236.1 methyl-accepting chemotaxis protein [Pseudomonas cichorii]MBX8520815.1 methyl-accepting chemotaxis protein [Pseudomonas cichorii]MBX8525317.1 methyl-accepting chemotaxis protein [Pseudomonas cichorii]MBX8534048.1 methyl-accepting chemotaxis protein [Pseudomonas cichorii]
MNTWFANISVKLKLALGFGAVLVLTCLMALTGWSGLGSLIERSDRVADIMGLNADMSELRLRRLQYVTENGDEKMGDVAQGLLNHLKEKHNTLLALFTYPGNQEKLQEMSKLTADYQQSYDRMREAYRSDAALRKTMGVHAVKGAEIIGRIIDDVLAMSPDDERRFGRYQAILKAKENLALIRYEVRGYTGNPNETTEKNAYRQLETALQGMEPLRAAFNGSYGDEFKQLESAIVSYRQAVDNFKAANTAISTARKENTAQGVEMAKVSEALYQLQAVRGAEDSEHARNMQIGGTVLALVLGILAALIITRQITGPLQDTLVEVERIASGDLSRNIAVTRRDELGVLQQGVQRMSATLRDLIVGIRDGVTQIASAAEQLSAVTEQTSAGVNNQKVETDQVATAMNEMSATVQEVAQNAEQASQAASSADREARDGDRVVGEAIAQIERLASEVGRSAEAMSELEQESNKIGKVMDVIKAVAEQTNLLALNAAIEAARAGEAGRGFAVVADEVRGLAQRTQQSTEEIESLVAGLQNGTRQVSGIMLNSRELTANSVTLSRKAGASLGSITQTVSTIQAMNQQIAAAAEQQNAVAEEITRSIINVRDVSEQTASASEETAASSVELARLGVQLQTMVSRFRV